MVCICGHDQCYHNTDRCLFNDECKCNKERAVSDRVVLKDSGKRQEFSTGSVRDSEELKGAYHLLPPEAIYQLSLIMELGQKKYGSRNWELGQPLSRYWNSACRHWFKVLRGDTDEPHASQALWNIACYIQTKKWIDEGVLPKALDDIPKYKQKENPK